MAEGAFVTVYHEDLIANYPGVWDDDRMLATWLRLLVIADKLWPSPAEVPKGVRTRELGRLVELGLVQELPHHRFRLKGLDARRQRQREAAKAAADARWNAASNAEGNAGRIAKAMPRVDRGARLRSGPPSGTPYSGGEGAGEGDPEPEFPLLQWLGQHGCYITPGNGYHRQLVTAVEHTGVDPFLEALNRLSRAGVQDGDTKGFVFGAIDMLRQKPDLRALEAEDDAEEARKRQAIKDQRAAANLAYLRGDYPSFAEAMTALTEGDPA